jgi:hypothetical protein
MQLLQSTITVSMLKPVTQLGQPMPSQSSQGWAWPGPFGAKATTPKKLQQQFSNFCWTIKLLTKTQNTTLESHNTKHHAKKTVRQHATAQKSCQNYILMIFPSFSHFPIIFPSFSHDFPIIFLPFSHDFPIIQLPSSGRLKATAARVVKSPRIKASTAWFGLFRSPKATVGENIILGIT